LLRLCVATHGLEAGADLARSRCCRDTATSYGPTTYRDKSPRNGI
jgi:hypothetical protein